MKLGVNCHQCLEQLVCQAAEIATSDPEIRERAREEGLRTLNRLFSYERTAPEIANEIHRVLREVTNNPDPYRQMKDRELTMSERLFKEVRRCYGDDLRSCIELAALGNTIDFFKELDKISEDMRKPIAFTIDHVDEFERRLRSAKKVLYLADNAGECFFDLPLLEKMREIVQVIYIVKGFPVQNDITLEDLSKAGLREKIGEVMTSGTDTVGVDFSSSSEEFKTQFEQADLIFAKGMGHYETLSELPVYGKIIYCSMAKCQTIADSLKVPLNSFIAMIQ
jgi:hypothetical protein